MTFSTPFIQIWLWLCDWLITNRPQMIIYFCCLCNTNTSSTLKLELSDMYELEMSAGWMERKCSSSVVTTSDHSHICIGFTLHRWMMISIFMPCVCYYRWQINSRFRLYLGLVVRYRLYWMNQLLVFQEAGGPVVTILLNEQPAQRSSIFDSIVRTRSKNV